MLSYSSFDISEMLAHKSWRRYTCSWCVFPNHPFTASTDTHTAEDPVFVIRFFFNRLCSGGVGASSSNGSLDSFVEVSTTEGFGSGF